MSCAANYIKYLSEGVATIKLDLANCSNLYHFDKIVKLPINVYSSFYFLGSSSLVLVMITIGIAPLL